MGADRVDGAVEERTAALGAGGPEARSHYDRRICAGTSQANAKREDCGGDFLHRTSPLVWRDRILP